MVKKEINWKQEFNYIKKIHKLSYLDSYKNTSIEELKFKQKLYNTKIKSLDKEMEKVRKSYLELDNNYKILVAEHNLISMKLKIKSDLVKIKKIKNKNESN